MRYLLFGLAAVTAPPTAPVAPEMTFGSWTVACDNHRDCGGVSLHETDGSAETRHWVLHFTRRSGADTPVKIEAYPAFQESDPGAVTVRIEGKASAFGFSKEGLVVGAGEKLLTAIAGAHRVELIDSAGKTVGVIPVEGASAAMRFVDDRQGRAGTATALVAKGAKPASAVPAPPLLPRIASPAVPKAQPRTLNRAQLSKLRNLASDLCQDELPSDPEFYRLDAAHSLAIVPCIMGAYQGASLIAVVDEKGGWKPAIIERYEKPDGPIDAFEAYALTEPEYDASKRLLYSMAKGHGRMFRLTSYQALNACAGAPPGSWLPRWQTVNDPLVDE
jgi:hypothetical protein